MPPLDSAQVMPREVGGETVAENPLQQQGYVRVYRAVAAACGMEAAMVYGILENYAQMGERSGRGCIPSHAALAREMGCSSRSVIRYLAALRDAGYVSWEATGEGDVNRYILHHDPTQNCQTPTTNCQTPLRQNGVPPYDKMSYKKERVNSNTSPNGGNPLTPFALFAAICESAGLDPTQFSQREKNKHMAVAKRLIEDGASVEEMRSHVGWLRSQRWRTQPVTVFTVEKEIGAWRASGKPERDGGAQGSSSRLPDGRLRVM